MKGQINVKTLESGYADMGICAATWDFQQCGIYSDEPVKTPLTLRNYKLCSVSSLLFIEHSSDKQRL